MKYILPLFLLFYSCASVQSLDGGSKDEIPPKIFSVYPDSASKNISTSLFVFTFDEYIKTTKINDLLIISPTQKIKPTITIKGKKLHINLNDTLQINTTYIFQFNGSIIDINEGNPLDNYNYIFSTGTYIDSLYHEGTVINILTDKPCKNCNIQLYNSFNDSLILTTKPNYITRTDDKGLYKLNNLPSATFNKIIIEDKNNNLLLDKEEYISLSKIISTTQNISDTTYIFPNTNKDKYKPIIKAKPGIITILLNKPIVSTNIKTQILNNVYKHHISNSRDTITMYYASKADTTPITLYIANDTFKLRYILPHQKKKYKLKVSATRVNTLLTIKSKTPIDTVYNDKINIYNDTISTTLQRDTITTLSSLFHIKGPSSKYTTLILQPGAIVDILGNTNKLDTITIHNKELQKSSLQIKLNTNDTTTYLIYIKQKDKTINYNVINKSTTLINNDLKPGKYKLHIITDTNNNGIWDTGDIFTKKPPENIQITNEFEIRQNWDKELIINVL